MRSIKLGLVAAAMLLGTTALTTPAFATNNTCHYNCNPPPPPPPKGGGDIDIDNTNHNTAIGVGVGVGYGGQGGQGGHGGQGGAGGKGGDADATAVNFNANVAKGGDAHAYNKNDIDIDNKNTNSNLNSNLNSNKNENTNSNSNSNSNRNKNENNNTNKQGQVQGQIQGQIQGQHQSSNNQNDNSNSNNANLEVNTYTERAPVNTAYSAGLVSGEDTCMGSSSIGAQAVSFGLTIGTTWTDDNCQRLKNSRQMVALGYHRAATSLMCFDDSVRQAMIDAGTPCPSGQQAAVYVAPAAAVYVAPAREFTPMAPVADEPVRKKRVRKALPPK